MAKYTPMIEQYLKIKAEYQDAFLFFRLGDFYELFFEDAIKAARELEITLTARTSDKEKIPMCGVPHHSAEQYITTLIEKGYKIAICEQVEDPKQAKGVVKREVVKVITPGTLIEGKAINSKENRFLVAVSDYGDGTFAIAKSDLTTGENYVIEIDGTFDDVLYELASISAKEMIITKDFPQHYIEKLKKVLPITVSYVDKEETAQIDESLLKNVTSNKLKETFSLLYQYIVKTQKRSLAHLQPVEEEIHSHFMQIDYQSRRNLELTETLREKKKHGSLLGVLDETVTSMGARLLKNWLERPLVQKKAIAGRLSAVESLIHDPLTKDELRDLLKEVYDLERLVGKVSFGNVNARELVQLRRSLEQIPSIIETVLTLQNRYLDSLFCAVDPCEQLCELLQRSIVDDPPVSVKEGGIIKDGFSEELDRYRDAARNGKAWIAQLENRERELTGIKSLKVGYNKVFGYYIEVTKPNIDLVPHDRYERKQTLANAERYITPELKEKEMLILQAEEKMIDLEYELFIQIRDEVKKYITKLQTLAKCLSTLDVLQSFATVSLENHYTKPEFSEEGEIHLIEARHPVVEQMLSEGQFVANDVVMNRDREILLITGPNMAGKSTYMRQLALIAVMAQIGCFVPAREAKLPIFDQIFTRIGAADDLASGQSTFMVEMLEAKHALTKATKHSLILLDEIGRGTSTYDGMALAQAIIEYIHDFIGAKTLFSTHYHELTALEKQLKRLKNVHVKAVEQDGKVVFLHKVVDGQADRSYGIYVAELAKMPSWVIQRAEELLETFEKPHTNKKEEWFVQKGEQLSLFPEENVSEKKKETLAKEEKKVLETIRKLDILNMTPLEAITKLNEMKKTLTK